MKMNDKDLPAASDLTVPKKTGKAKAVSALALDQFKERQKLPILSALPQEDGPALHLPPDAAEFGDFYHL
jgi:hypothetical protein